MPLVTLARAYDHMNQGDLAIEKGDIDRATEHYGTAARLVPESPEMVYWQGIGLASKGQVDRAMPLLQQAFKADKAWVELTRMSGLLFWLGLVFEMPLVIYLLARVGVVTPQSLSKFRRYAIVGAFVAAAVITPTVDPVNQALVAVPIVLLYELGILLSRIAVRARAR